MSRTWRLQAVLAGFLAAACQPVAVVPAGRAAPPVSVPVNEPAAIRNFTELVNQYRKKIGCPALAWDVRIAAIAQAHSEEMAQHDFVSHINLKGENAFGRLDAAGIKWSSASENIAYGQPTPGEVLTSWLNSPGHRRNIDNCKYTRHGVGLESTRWTHVFVGG